ncbi:unnamed protein product, partial [Owenia fusiformis]
MNMYNKLKWNMLILTIMSTQSTDSKYKTNSTISTTTEATGDVAILDGSINQNKSGVSANPNVNETEQPNVSANPNVSETEQPNVSANPNVSETEQPNVSANPNVSETEQPNVSANPNVSETEQPNVSANPNVSETEQPNVSANPNVSETEQPNVSVNPNVSETEQPTVRANPNVSETEQPNVSANPNISETEQPNVSANPNVSETEQPNVSANPNVSETEQPNVSANPNVSDTEQPNRSGQKKPIRLKRNVYETLLNKAKCENNPVKPLFINETYVLITREDYGWLVLCMNKITPKKVCLPPYNPNSRKYEIYTTMGIITEIYLCIPLCLLGIVGNVLSFITLSREKQNTSILILKSLAIIDSLYLLLVVVFEPYYTAYHDTDWLDKSSLDKVSHSFTKAATYAVPVINMAQMCSAWLMVLLTIDRYVAICHPFKAIIYCTLRRVRVGICIIIFTSIVYNIPMFWEVSFTQVYHECLKLHMFTKGVVRGSVGQHILFRIIYGLAGNLIFRNLLPVLLVISFNCRLIHSLRIARRNHDKMTAKQDNDLDNRDKNI